MSGDAEYQSYLGWRLSVVRYVARWRRGHIAPPRKQRAPLSEYLDMQKAIGNETRFRIVNFLVESGPRSATQIRDALGLESNTLHYHLDRLVDVGLVANRKRNDPDEAGLHSFYRATSLGEGILEHGVRELMAEEWELLDAYGD